MKQITLVFKTAKDAANFVKVAEVQPYEMDLIKKRWEVDAKSLLGVLSLGVDGPILLVAHDDRADLSVFSEWSV